jgi:hypothetical protein
MNKVDSNKEKQKERSESKSNQFKLDVRIFARYMCRPAIYGDKPLRRIVRRLNTELNRFSEHKDMVLEELKLVLYEENQIGKLHDILQMAEKLKSKGNVTDMQRWTREQFPLSDSIN